MDAALQQHDDTLPLEGVPPRLGTFQSKDQLQHISDAPKPRCPRRLSDQIKASFYEACRIGNIHAARQMAEALSYELARSLHSIGADLRENGDGLAAVWARYGAEVAQQQDQKQAASSFA